MCVCFMLEIDSIYVHITTLYICVPVSQYLFNIYIYIYIYGTELIYLPIL